MGVVKKMEKKSLWAFCNLQRRLISAAHVAEMHGVACCAQRHGLVTRAVGAARLSATKALASHLLIRLPNFPKAFNGVGAAADVFTCVQRLSGVAMS